MTRKSLYFGPVGIIDIGSNSVRLVVYAGAERVPSTLYNEKVMAGLGRTIGSDGAMDEEAIELALRTLERFRMVMRQMGVKRFRTVATAAVREATNGKAFLAKVAKLGLKPEVLSGEEEAVTSAAGVLSGIPWAKGVVADLGGGSLELVGVARGQVGSGVSLPLGVLRVGSDPDRDAIRTMLEEALASTQIPAAARGSNLYLVGGSFRAIAQLEMQLVEHPLPIVHQHRLRRDQLGPIADYVAEATKDEIKDIGNVSGQRVPHLPAAIAILETLIEVLAPRKIKVSAFGLREGVLYRDLDWRRRKEDPLLAAAFEVGHKLGRFGDHGAQLDQWIAPLFPKEPEKLARLRLAACLLGDIAWNAHPDYRAERAVDLAVHGNWVGINGRGRVLLGRALHAAFGNGETFPLELDALLKDGDAARAEQWGLAIRLAQRFSAGTLRPLSKGDIALKGGKLDLSLPETLAALYSPAVEKRHQQLALAMGAEARLVLT
ncbi:Ppx/GppA family phosphatase [Sphingomicrobium nitratireducens]|uniref:Ppx/GppA family phosphatase n=1 Tax=Sphingomicrobium nitratireducens TaxID=2964666 RepID=UPI0022404EE7|nr:Ppx/GppA family phosphatase [Sphingomicrobium nitratireducens]